MRLHLIFLSIQSPLFFKFSEWTSTKFFSGYFSAFSTYILSLLPIWFFLHSCRRHRYCLVTYHRHSSTFMIHHSGLGEEIHEVIDRLALDRIRSTLHVQYFLITLYTVLEVGPRRTLGSWTGAPLRGGEGGENGPTERAHRGNCAPTSGSPVAPSRTCRLFPRRDSRSPHLSSVRPASPKLPSFPRSVFDPLTTDGTRVHRGYGAGGWARLFIFRYFWSATREIYTLRAYVFDEYDLSISEECHRIVEGRVEKYLMDRLIVMDRPENVWMSFKNLFQDMWRKDFSSSLILLLIILYNYTSFIECRSVYWFLLFYWSL